MGDTPMTDSTIAPDNTPIPTLPPETAERRARRKLLKLPSLPYPKDGAR